MVFIIISMGQIVVYNSKEYTCKFGCIFCCCFLSCDVLAPSDIITYSAAYPSNQSKFHTCSSMVCWQAGQYVVEFLPCIAELPGNSTGTMNPKRTILSQGQMFSVSRLGELWILVRLCVCLLTSTCHIGKLVKLHICLNKWLMKAAKTHSVTVD